MQSIQTQSFKRALPKTIYFVFGLSFLLSSFATYFHYLETHRYTLQIEMAAHTDTKIAMVQVFFDTGKGFTQNNSEIHSIDCDDKFHILSYSFPISKVKQIRLDPLNTSGIILLKEIKLITHQGVKALSFNLDNILPLFQIKSINPLNEGVKEITTSPKADDPSIDLKYSPPGMYPLDVKDLLTFGLKLFLIYFIGLLSVVLMSNPGTEKY